MKNASRVFVVLSSALLLTSSGGVAKDVRSARRLEVIDSAPANQAKGYVEFHARSGKGVIPIYIFDEPKRPVWLAATGLREGDHYSAQRHPTTVAERLRVAMPAGPHTFMIQRDGELLRVPVQENKTTLVEID